MPHLRPWIRTHLSGNESARYRSDEKRILILSLSVVSVSICGYEEILQCMKTNILILLMVASAVGSITCGAAETKDSASPAENAKTSGPRIQFATNVFDFGKVDSGQVVRHDFVFTNVGTATLEITDVRPGCGCTTAGSWDKKVEPGKTGIIPLQFNSANFGGMVTKSATVSCTDPGRSNVILQITGTVWKPIDITPTMASFNLASDSTTNETKVLRIVSNLEEPITLSDVQCANPSFKVELKTVQAGKEFALHVTAMPPLATPTVYAPITLKTSSAKMPTLSLSAYVTVQQPVMVTPKQIHLPMGPLANAMNPSIMIRSTATNALVLSDATVDGVKAEVRMQEIQPGHVFSLTVSFPVGFQIKPDQKAELKGN